MSEIVRRSAMFWGSISLALRFDQTDLKMIWSNVRGVFLYLYVLWNGPVKVPTPCQQVLMTMNFYSNLSNKTRLS